MAFAALLLLPGCGSTPPDDGGGETVVHDGLVYTASVGSSRTSVIARLRIRNPEGQDREVGFPGDCRIALILYSADTLEAERVWDGRENVGCFDIAAPVRLDPFGSVQFDEVVRVDSADGAGRLLKRGHFRATIWVYAHQGFGVEAGEVVLE